MGCGPSKNAAERKVVPTINEPTNADDKAKTVPITSQPSTIGIPPPLVAVNTTERPPTPREGWSKESESKHTSRDTVAAPKHTSKENIAEAKPGQTTAGSQGNIAKSLDKAPMPPIHSQDEKKDSVKDETEHTSVTDVPTVSTAAEAPTKPIAFEIPLDDALFGPSPSTDKTGSAGSLNRARPAPSSGRLPSLGLTNDDIKAKLANADARWKVGMQIERLLGDIENLEEERKTRRRRHGAKPELSSNARPKTRQGRDEDPETLKQRLIEKEAQAEKNRQRELQKQMEKLARKDQHVRRVQERKRFLERDDSMGEFSLSVSTSSVSLAVQ